LNTPGAAAHEPDETIEMTFAKRNASDDLHPMHLHRHSFELTKLAGQPTAGIIKDVVMLGGYQEVEVDFTADHPGLTLRPRRPPPNKRPPSSSPPAGSVSAGTGTL